MIKEDKKIQQLEEQQEGKTKINYFKILKLIYPLALLAVSGGLIFTVWFMYSNFYKTMTETQTVTTLQKELMQNILNKDGFDALIKSMQNKTTAKSITPNKNTFTPLPAPKVK
ncbi:MAG: hypothetical protein WCP18_00560 [bacterium]